MNDRLKKIIFDKLYKDLSHVEIIPHQDSIWFIDRENKYWYFEYVKTGVLWWRQTFFTEFFSLFSMERDEFQSVLSEWVEEVLNCKVNTTGTHGDSARWRVEEALNCKVNTTNSIFPPPYSKLEEVLNCKVNTTHKSDTRYVMLMETVLNCKVNTTMKHQGASLSLVEEVLNCKVNKTLADSHNNPEDMEEALNCKVHIPTSRTFDMSLFVEKILK